jgi:hypothetical protein
VNDRKSFIEYSRYILAGLFIILVVSSAVFVIYTLSLRHEGPATVAAVPGPAPRGAEGTHVELPSVQPSPDTTPRALPSVTQPEAPTGPLPSVRKFPQLYAVVIAAYADHGVAADEVARWADAGYIASVIRTKKHYLVALGQYESVPEAKTFAEGMFEAFENGYWVGVIE